MMVLSGLKGEIGMSRKSVTENIAQSHIYGQAHTILHKTSHQQLQAVCYVDNEMHTTSNLSPHKELQVTSSMYGSNRLHTILILSPHQQP